ncbi:MAG: hypothetical protein ACI36Z_01310 [Alloprevotella sp.]
MRTLNYIGRKVRYQKVVTASGRSLVFYMPRPASGTTTMRE